MQPIIDPRSGDVEDDASSTKSRKLAAIAGSMLAEISFPKLIVAWVLLIGLPGLLLGLAPPVAWAWLSRVSDKFAAISGIGSLLIFAGILLVGWYGIRPLFRFMERSFWSLQALAVQPVYAACREGLSQIAEGFLEPEAKEQDRSRRRAKMAAVAGFLACAIGVALVALAWPYTQWTATWQALSTPSTLLMPALANAITIVAGYLAAASIVWGLTDAVMEQPEKFAAFEKSNGDGKRFRIAHLSDLHTVGERFGFRIESGRLGPQGNGRLDAVLERLQDLHDHDPLEVILITGDMTDAGRSAEWAEFFCSLARHPRLLERTLILPGNHDLNVADRANPARLELPTSPRKQLRQMRMVSAMAAVQGRRAFVCDRAKGEVGPLLADAIEPAGTQMKSLADVGRFGPSSELSRLWSDVFPLIVPPRDPGGLGIILMNSNAQTNFSFTNALGLVSADDVAIACKVIGQYPGTAWIIALHHHLVEYPLPVKAFSERIGTALINGSWLVRKLRPVATRVAMMHGHRHIDWIGRIGRLTVISAPSPVMEAKDGDATCFYVHTVVVRTDGNIALTNPEKVAVAGQALS